MEGGDPWKEEEEEEDRMRGRVRGRWGKWMGKVLLYKMAGRESPHILLWREHVLLTTPFVGWVESWDLDGRWVWSCVTYRWRGWMWRHLWIEFWIFEKCCQFCHSQSTEERFDELSSLLYERIRRHHFMGGWDMCGGVLPKWWEGGGSMWRGGWRGGEVEGGGSFRVFQVFPFVYWVESWDFRPCKDMCGGIFRVSGKTQVRVWREKWIYWVFYRVFFAIQSNEKIGGRELGCLWWLDVGKTPLGANSQLTQPHATLDTVQLNFNK